ncbi:hypothetical protein M569_02899 [Genlisea aurea]|uniref:DUF4057 domain-containing protein n=1 Tax=Genlisea aurea TaxID=192259 RepID=S8D397_9LAMI|nr:hypothetical protein M569_02899 [Genlisea aurea]
MEKSAHVRKTYASTADLLTWTENPPEISHAPPSSARSHQPSDGISKVVFGGQVTDEEVESLNKRKPCSDYKMKEMTGSGIFKAKGEEEPSEADHLVQPSSNKTGLRMYQQTLSGISHISFSEEETISLKKPTTLPEVAKQRELSGNLETESEARLKKQLSDAKNRELTGHDIFAPPPEIQPRPLTTRALALRESITIGSSDVSTAEHVVKTAKKIPDQKFTELLGNGIFEGDATTRAPPPAEKQQQHHHLSSAKMKEISGSNIFADGKVESRDYFGGVRKPPGGESSIALV